MRSTIFSPTVFALCVFSMPALADTFTVDTSIESATLYETGGVNLVRRGSIALPAGKHTLILPSLHGDINDGDIPPTLLLPSSVQLLSVTYVDQPSSESASQLQQAIRGKITSKENEITHVRNAISVYELQLSFLRSLGSKSEVSLDVEALSKTIGFISDKAAVLYADIQKQRLIITAKTAELEALKRELARTGDALADYKKAILTVQVSETQTHTVAVSYFLDDASWSMGLEAELDTKSKTVLLTQKASLSQTTGENWDDVILTLSGSVPSYYLGDISVSPELLSFYDKTEQMKYRSTDMMTASAPRFEEMVVMDAVRKNTGYDHVFELAGKSSLKADGSIESVMLAQHQLPVRLVSRVAPLSDTTAYVFADTTLTGFDSLRDIDVIARRDGLFVGGSMWPALEKDASVQLPFGQDKNIEVSYSEQAGEDGEKGFISKKSLTEKRYLITVKNNNTKATTVEVFDRYPVPTHEDIEVTPLKDATKPTIENINDQPGVISWKKTLAPGQEWRITHTYQIKYPEDKKLQSRTNR